MAGEASYSARWAARVGSGVLTFPGSPFTGTTRWAFKEDGLAKEERLLRTPATTGRRAQGVWQTRRGSDRIGGTLTIDASPKFLGWMLPLGMGGGTETAPALADAIPEFALQCDRGTATATNFGDCVQYSGLKINQWVLRASPDELVECAIDVLGKLETEGQTFLGPDEGITLPFEPYQMADMAFVYDGAGTPITLNMVGGWEIGMSNGLTARPNNSLHVDEIFEGERNVWCRGNLAIHNTTMIDQLYTSVVKNGKPGGLVITNGACSTTFTFAAIQLPRRTHRREGPEFILPFQGEARAITATTQEFTVANDVTP